MNELLEMLVRAARGALPHGDGDIDVLPPPPGPADAVLAFTGRHVVAADVGERAVLAQIPQGSLSAPMRPPFLVWLGRKIGREPGSLDILLSADADESLCDLLVEVEDLDHPRVDRARRYRDDVRAFKPRDGGGIVTVGRGLAGRWEVTFEVDPEQRNSGLGRQLARASRSLVPADEPIFAQVAPGNAASLRATLAAGFRPLGGEVLYFRDGR